MKYLKKSFKRYINKYQRLIGATMHNHFTFIAIIIGLICLQSCQTMQESQKYQRNNILKTFDDKSKTIKNHQSSHPRKDNQSNSTPQLLKSSGKLSWHSPLNPKKTFQEFLKVVPSRYKIKKIDEKQKVIETDWDIFYMEKKLFRNKLNIIIIPTNNDSEVMITNHLEYMAEKLENRYKEELWIPCNDITNEPEEIIRQVNMNLENKN